MKQGWQEIEFEKSIEKIEYTNKIPRKNFLKEGKYPIISQEESLINGYWNDQKDLFKSISPIIIFGDHTKILKYIDFDFVLGADGVKILKPINQIVPKYFYYFLLNIKLRTLGYARHYRLLREQNISYPVDISEQKRIVKILDSAFEDIEKIKENSKQNLQNSNNLFQSYLNKLFTENSKVWKEMTLNDVCKKILAGGDKPTLFSKVKTKQYSVPIYANAFKDSGLYGFTDKPTINEHAVTVSARGTIGFICNRFEPFYPIVRLIVAIPNESKITIEFLSYALKFIIPEGNGTSIPQLTIPNFKKNKIFIPSISEQKQIVKKLDMLQEKTKKLEEIYNKKLQLAEELKQSILHKAFNGEL